MSHTSPASSPPSASAPRFHSVNPWSGEALASYPTLSEPELSQALERAHRAFRVWRNVSLPERAAALRRLAESIRPRAKHWARLAALEMGKPIREGIAEVEKCVSALEHFAERGPQALEPESVSVDSGRAYVSYESLGIALGIMPWNFPYWQVFRFAAPALLAGNTILFKPAPSVAGTALEIEAAFDEAELPEDIFQALFLPEGAVSLVIEDPRVRVVTLTGSVRAGRAVASAAGAALTKCILELGGSDPYVVMEDADLDHAVDVCFRAKMINGGQSCIAAKRLIVPQSLLPEFESRLVARMKAVVPANPLDETSMLGPLARSDLRDELHRQVRATIDAGARLVLGGEIPQGPGFSYPPTLLSDVGVGMTAYHEELFGPIAVLCPAVDEQDALRIANDTRFGLGACVLSKDTERAETVARRELDAGACFVNDFVRSDPRLPFGGTKDSGIGRELGVHGVREFTNVKTVFVAD